VHRCSNFNPYHKHVSAASKQALLQRNQLDAELYDYGVALQREQLAKFADQPCLNQRYVCPKDSQCYAKKAMSSPYASYHDLMSTYSQTNEALGELSGSLICIQTCRVSDADN
jgi:hypothetical protein